MGDSVELTVKRGRQPDKARLVPGLARGNYTQIPTAMKTRQIRRSETLSAVRRYQQRGVVSRSDDDDCKPRTAAPPGACHGAPGKSLTPVERHVWVRKRLPRLSWGVQSSACPFRSQCAFYFQLIRFRAASIAWSADLTGDDGVTRRSERTRTRRGVTGVRFGYRCGGREGVACVHFSSCSSCRFSRFGL
jgi:hypothetical protein